MHGENVGTFLLKEAEGVCSLRVFFDVVAECVFTTRTQNSDIKR